MLALLIGNFTQLITSFSVYVNSKPCTGLSLLTLNLRKMFTYVVINALAWCRSGFHDVVVVSVIDQQKTTGFDAFFEVFDCLFLLALVAV